MLTQLALLLRTEAVDLTVRGEAAGSAVEREEDIRLFLIYVGLYTGLRKKTSIITRIAY